MFAKFDPPPNIGAPPNAGTVFCWAKIPELKEPVVAGAPNTALVVCWLAFAPNGWTVVVLAPPNRDALG